LKNKSCMAYPAVSPEVTACGGKFIEQNRDFSDAHVDGNLVSAAAWPAHPEWIRKFLELLGTKISI
jgi:protease I